MDELPVPDPEALLISEQVGQRLAQTLNRQGGWIGFDTFMRTALYEPGLGYYSGPMRRFGPQGDFVTAPEISPLFGGCVASACRDWFEQVDPVITEFGAGTGQLAAQVLNALDRMDAAPRDYQIIELSASLRQQQLHTLQTLAPQMVSRVQWLDGLPDQFNGVVLANEVLDAMPVRLFELRAGRVHERGLIADADAHTGLAWQSRAAEPAMVRAVTESLAAAGWGGDDPGALDYGCWPDGYSSEIGMEAAGWIQTVGERLFDGVILSIDYGFPAAEFFHPQRATGTLACHYRHLVHYDPLPYPGLQDITAHVDYSAVARAARSVGLDLLGYTSQASFLLHSGLLDALSQVPVEQTADYNRQSQAVQKLVSETEMGELFKVIALASGDIHPGAGFSGRDRSSKLTC
jgi:SAM-dependent MidA family methyltransferase